jgi:O-antigen/teichoic acid export membrane protein
LSGLLKAKPFDTSTEEGRSRERYRRAALTSFTSLLARCVTVVTGLITVRLTVRYLGTERYGLWMTITSVVAMMAFADLGIGNGLLSSISDAHGRDDRDSVRKYVSSAFFVLLGIATVLIGLFAAVYPLVPWPRVFNVSSLTAAREAGPAVLVFLVCFALNMPLDVVQRVQTGHQEGFETNLWNAGGSLMGLACLLVAMHLNAGLPVLLLSLSGGGLLGILGNWAHQFGWVRPWLLPRWSFWDASAARKILGIGTMFFVLQACGLFTVTADNIIITQLLGPEAVTQYAVPMRLFLLLISVTMMFVTPLWPAYGEALARGDVRWVRSTLFHSVCYSLLAFGPVAVGLATFGKLIVHTWVGGQIQPSYPLLFGMAVWTILAVFGNTTSMFFAGTNTLKFQVVVSVVMAIANLVLKIILAKLYGLSGVAWAPVLSGLPAAALYLIYLRRLLTGPGVFQPAQPVADRQATLLRDVEVGF